MSALEFTHNAQPTLGVEIELQLVDAETYALSNSIDALRERMTEDERAQIKPELMQSYLEINTGVCETVAEAGSDLQGKLNLVANAAEPLGLKLFWGGTHPFSSWRDQKVTVNDRYYELVELMQDVARRLVTFGLHVHVGVDTGDKAIMICDRMLRHLPLLLALSSNSPFWEGRATGLHSNRALIMGTLPTAGLPHRMRNWSEYVWLINHLVDTGFINTIREIWWDIRPHHEFGTVEIRMADMPCKLHHVLAITAVVQCLVQSISEEIDEGTYHLDYHPMMVEQNKWRAARYGGDASLVDSDDYVQYGVQQAIERLVTLLRPMADRLGCREELESATRLPANTGAKQQLEIYRRTGSREDVVREMIERNDWRVE